MSKARKENRIRESTAVKAQYERFPYPPVPFLALPRRDQGEQLKFELGQSFLNQTQTHRGIRILVAGCGTLEALVVAQAHPWAQEIVAVDLSEKSLETLHRRIQWAKIARLQFRSVPIRLRCMDLHEFAKDSSQGLFDYILLSNVVHHVPNPAELLHLITQRLKPQGLLRLVTYPKASRFWMRACALWLKEGGLTLSSPDLKRKTLARIRQLPDNHPIRLCYESQPETQTVSGLVDAFYHICENPLSPLEWKNACIRSSLRLIGESQNETSQSRFLTEIVPELHSLGRWEKLQILDDLWELCANPILWLQRDPNLTKSPNDLVIPDRFPTSSRQEVKEGLDRIRDLIAPHQISLETLWNRFKQEVGPRVSPTHQDRILPGLALTDYPIESIDSNFWSRQTLDQIHLNSTSYSPSYTNLSL